MKILSKGDFRNIKKNQEYVDVETSDGKTLRLIVDLDTNKVRLIVDHDLIRECKQTEDFTPYIEIDSFYND